MTRPFEGHYLRVGQHILVKPNKAGTGNTGGPISAKASVRPVQTRQIGRHAVTRVGRYNHLPVSRRQSARDGRSNANAA